MSNNEFMTVWAPVLAGAIIGVLGTIATTQWLIHRARKDRDRDSLKSVEKSLGTFYFACNRLPDQDPNDWLLRFTSELQKCTLAISLNKQDIPDKNIRSCLTKLSEFLNRDFLTRWSDQDAKDEGDMSAYESLSSHAQSLIRASYDYVYQYRLGMRVHPVLHLDQPTAPAVVPGRT